MVTIINCLLIGVCMWFSVTDIKSRRIPNKLTHPIIVLMLLIRLLNPVYYWGLIPAVAMLIIYFIRPNALGAGDVKMAAIIGLCLGIEKMIVVMFGMCISALTSQYVYQLLTRQKLVSIPLAPFFSIGVFLALMI